MLSTMRRLTALFLALILCLSPLSALAEGETVTYSEPQDENILYVHADGTDNKYIEVRDVTRPAGGYAGVTIQAYGQSTVNVTTNNVTTSGEYNDGINIDAGGTSNVFAGFSAVTTSGDKSDGIRVYANGSSVVEMTAGAVNTSGEVSNGVIVMGMVDASAVNVRTRSVTAGGTTSDGVRVDAFSSQPTTMTVLGNVDAALAGVRTNTSGGQAIVTVTGAVSGGTDGISVYSTHEGSSTTITVGKTNDAGVFTGSAVTGGTDGIVADAKSGGHLEIRTGDVKGGTNGVTVFSNSTGGTADILIDGTLSAGQQAVVVNENTTEDDLSLTVWKVEQAGAGAALVSGSGTGENAFTDDSIQYIVRTDQGPRFEGQPVGSLSAAKDAEGTVLDTAASGETTCGVAHEGDRIYLNMEYDTDKYEVIGAYVDEEKKIEAQKDEDGHFYTEVSKGGGVFLSATLMEKHDHTPRTPVREEPYLIPGLYDMVTYCTVCGQELSRVSYAEIDASGPEPEPVHQRFTEFCEKLARRIRKAPENGVVEVDAREWVCFRRAVFEALDARTDVTLIVTCLLNGVRTELTIPAGSGLLDGMGDEPILTFEEITKIVG